MGGGDLNIGVIVEKNLLMVRDCFHIKTIVFQVHVTSIDTRYNHETSTKTKLTLGFTAGSLRSATYHSGKKQVLSFIICLALLHDSSKSRVSMKIELSN